MISALSKQADGTIELTITIPAKKVSEAYQKALTTLSAKAEIKGFRKGKAPEKIVEEKLGKSAVYEEALRILVPEVYVEAIKEQKVAPAMSPKINVVSLEEKKDWQIKATTCELPKISLGDYKGEVKKALATEKIWVPGKDEDQKEKPQETQEQKLQKVFAVLIKTVKFQIPSVLSEEEVNRMLSRLLDQTGRLGLTVEQYLASTNKTIEQIREEYKKQAEESLKLELILSAIADKEKVEIKDSEIEKMVQTAPDEKSKKAMETPAQKTYLRQLLRKRTVIDNLLKL